MASPQQRRITKSRKSSKDLKVNGHKMSSCSHEGVPIDSQTTSSCPRHFIKTYCKGCFKFQKIFYLCLLRRIKIFYAKGYQLLFILKKTESRTVFMIFLSFTFLHIKWRQQFSDILSPKKTVIFLYFQLYELVK